MELAWSHEDELWIDLHQPLDSGGDADDEVYAEVLMPDDINAELSRLSARVAELEAENARLRKVAEKTVDAYCPICVNKGNLSSDRGCGACVIFGLRAALVQP